MQISRSGQFILGFSLVALLLTVIEVHAEDVVKMTASGGSGGQLSRLDRTAKHEHPRGSMSLPHSGQLTSRAFDR